MLTSRVQKSFVQYNNFNMDEFTLSSLIRNSLVNKSHCKFRWWFSDLCSDCLSTLFSEALGLNTDIDLK